MVLKEDAQEEFIIAVSERLKNVKDYISQAETSDEARGFVIGSLGTLVTYQKYYCLQTGLKK